MENSIVETLVVFLGLPIFALLLFFWMGKRP
jgi:hypothetical protein